jgi:peptidoglycan/LPS O-acetylase OafA/YrhL
MSGTLIEVESIGVESKPQDTTAVHKPRRFYAPELDALRFMAFLMIFARHVATNFGLAKNRLALAADATASNPTVHGHPAALHISHSWELVQGAMQSMDFAVSLFFFLSSFLITRLLLIEKQDTGTVAIRDFYVRRSLRIWPLYFFFLALIAVVSQFIPVLHMSVPRVLAAVFFVSNWAAVFHGWASISIQPLWSVSVEEQFYLVWPQLARFGRSAIVTLSVMFSVVSVCALFYLGQKPDTIVSQVLPNTLVQGLFFAGGALMAALSRPEDRRWKLPVRLLSVLGGLVCWLAASSYFHIMRTESPGSFDLIVGHLAVILGTFLVFSGFAGASASLFPKPVLYFGKISYGLYVFHVACLMVTEHLGEPLLARMHLPHGSLLVTVGVSSLLGLMLTMVCAMLSYKLIEAPFLTLKKRFTVVPSRPA